MSGSGTGIVTPYNTHRGMDHDGAADGWTRAAGLTGAADGKLGTFSGWFRIDGGDGNRLTMIGGGGFCEIRRENSNRFRFLTYTAAAALVLDIQTNVNVVAGADWRHVMASWNMANAAQRHLYLDGADALQVTAYNNLDMDYTRAAWAYAIAVGGGSPWEGAVSETYFQPGEYIDLSVAANRWLFRHPNGQPPNIGADGSSPTGTQPLMYMVEVGSAMTNLGSGGAFVVAGAPTLSANSPKDRWVASLNHWQRKRKSAAA